MVWPDPDGYLDSQCISRLARIADDFNRNLWIVRNGLDQVTRAFVANVANSSVNLVEAYEPAGDVITKRADQDITEFLSANPERDVVIPSGAIPDFPPTGERSAVVRRMRTRQPKISVITAVLNGARFIQDAIRTCFFRDIRIWSI